MASMTPRMRMFAGPNGSGKSVLKSYLPKPLLGVYLNPDEVEAIMRQRGELDCQAYGIVTDAAEATAFFAGSAFLKSEGLEPDARKVRFHDGRLDFAAVDMRDSFAYFASATVDFLRKKLVERKVSFTFETVMSHASKIELLADAQRAGYRTYLYYVATDDPEINVSRVSNRVAMGGA